MLDNKMIKIIDIIQHKNKYGTQTMLIVDRPPIFKYEKKGNLLVGEDSGFFSFYTYKRPSTGFRAFGGRKFDIPLKSGEIEKAQGQWWNCLPHEYKDAVYTLGVATVKELEKCYVFYSMKVKKELVDTWLLNNKPSTNYYKYSKKSLGA